MSDYGSEETSLPVLTPAPKKCEKNSNKTQNKEFQTILPNITNFSIPFQTQQNGSSNTNGMPNGVQSLPFPLLIVQQKPSVNNGEVNQTKLSNLATVQTVQQTQQAQASKNCGEIGVLLKDLVDIQRENLSIERQRLELDKEKLEYQKKLGSELITIIPVFGSILQKLLLTTEELETESSPQKNGKKKKSTTDEIPRGSKILRTVLEKSFKKYIMEDDTQEESDQDEGALTIKNKESPPSKRKKH